MIKDYHEITSQEFKAYTNNFWGSEKPKPKAMNRVEINEMIKGSSEIDYIQFTFNEEKNNIFANKIVNTHTFETMCSCLPAITFIKLIEDALFTKIEISKGIKKFPKMKIPAKYEGSYYVVLVKVYFSDDKIQYLDIVEDPARD